MNAEEESMIRRGLSAAAQSVTASSDLFDRVAAARGRRRVRTGSLIAVAGGVVIAAVVVSVAISLHRTTTSAAPVRVVAPTQAPAGCLETFAPGGLKLFNTWRGPGLVDPGTTQVVACRYGGRPTNPWVWRLERSQTLTGATAADLARWLNAAPAADLHKRCPATDQEEVWSFMTGTTKTALIEVQLNGCGFANDGHRVVQWQRPGVTRNVK